MNEPQEIKESYFVRRESIETIRTSNWIPSYQSTMYQNNLPNRTYTSHITINQKPIQEFICSLCQNEINENKIEFNKRFYHLNCFQCSICKKNLKSFENNEFKLNLNGEPICSNCELINAEICSNCNKQIFDDDILTLDQNNYHSNCFNCSKCQKSLIDQTNIRKNNSKLFCSICYDQQFSTKCFQCYQFISNEKIIDYNGNKYHFNCFRCNKCNQTIGDTTVSIVDSKVHCNQCYEKYFAPICYQCSKTILNEKFITLNQNKYHLDCFKCHQCNKIINDKDVQTINCKPICLECYANDSNVQCHQCSKVILNEKLTIFNGNKYHLNCFRCNQCNQPINTTPVSIVNSKPYCNQCFEKDLAPLCPQCSKPILDGKSIMFKDKKYHSQCFRCQQCNKIMSNESIAINNSKHYCEQCYRNNFAPKCEKCFKAILDDGCTIVDGKKYHKNCLQCFLCNKVIMEKEFPAENGNIYCFKCFEEFIAPKCNQCSKTIITGRSIHYQGNKYHPECFRCSKCNKIMTEDRFHSHNMKPCCNQCYNEHFLLKCTKCLQPIDGRYTQLQNKPFHIQCFTCSKCNRIIETGDSFSNGDFGILCSNVLIDLFNIILKQTFFNHILF